MKITTIEMLNAYYGDLFEQLSRIKRFLTVFEWHYMHAKLRWRYKHSYRLLRKYERIQNNALLNIFEPELEHKKRKQSKNTLEQVKGKGEG